MLVQVKAYIAKCDRCGYEDGDPYTNKRELINFLRDHGWSFGTIVQCDECGFRNAMERARRGNV